MTENAVLGNLLELLIAEAFGNFWTVFGFVRQYRCQWWSRSVYQ